MLRDVYVHGAAGREFGRHFQIDVATPQEAVRALITLRPGLRNALRVGLWRVIVGRPHIANAVDALNMTLGSQPLHLVPATRPAGGDAGGIGKAIAGVALIGAAMVFAPIGAIGFGAAMGAGAFGGAALGMTYGGIAMLGASMAISGVMGMISQPSAPQQAASMQSATDYSRPEDRPSFLFNGVVNNTQQGGPVPLVFGHHLAGSVVVSAGIQVEDIPA